ncbi:hypothetical protein HELRODRAFT_160977 [Helobdella robusta]|uniref:Uncharacterized protein n=1 Tax=Helobdella robusta TaxID=6412 RepID=T1EQY4_HELRO|nr:hypothetical protein HELRODRAFT_160977 [Helobdella robusta]ESO01810.1 hypothetical protein HELRODRAFT_160977 [Helobdella robusta]
MPALEELDTKNLRKKLRKRNLESKAVLTNSLKDALVIEGNELDDFDFPDFMEKPKQQYTKLKADCNRRFDQQAEKLNEIDRELNDKIDQQSKDIRTKRQI